MAAVPQSPAQIRRTLWIVWGAMLASVGPYLAAGYLLAARAQPRALPPGFGIALGAVAGAFAAGTLALRSIGLVRPIRAGRLDPRSPAGAARVLTLSLISFVLADSIVVFELVLALWSASFAAMLPFAAASLALLAVHAPRFENLLPPASSAEAALRPDPLR